MIPKFRAYVKNDDRYLKIDSDKWSFTFDDSYEKDNVIMHDQMIILKTDKEHVVLSTGLKDKNDVEIYEGDIVKNIYDEIYVVKWLDAGFYLEEKYNGGFDYSELHFGDNKEVIGNIYENSELLEEK